MREFRTSRITEPPPEEPRDIVPLGGLEPDEELAILAKALAHPARIRILRLLDREAACICGYIVENMPFAQSTVSQHLKVLKEAGLIRGTVEGPKVCYRLDPGKVRRLKVLVAGI